MRKHAHIIDIHCNTNPTHTYTHTEVRPIVIDDCYHNREPPLSWHMFGINRLWIQCKHYLTPTDSCNLSHIILRYQLQEWVCGYFLTDNLNQSLWLLQFPCRLDMLLPWQSTLRRYTKRGGSVVRACFSLQTCKCAFMWFDYVVIA